MKMKNIERILKGASENTRTEFATRRIKTALEVAKLNAQEELADAEERKATYEAEDRDAECVICDLVNIFTDIDDAKRTIEMVEKVEKFLNEDVEID